MGGQEFSKWADSSSPSGRTGILQVGGRDADLYSLCCSAPAPARSLRERPPVVCLGTSSATPARRRLQAACRHAGEQNRCGEPTVGLEKSPSMAMSLKAPQLAHLTPFLTGAGEASRIWLLSAVVMKSPPRARLAKRYAFGLLPAMWLLVTRLV